MKRYFYWLLPLLLFLCYAPWSGKVDLAVSRYFYQPELLTHRPFTQNALLYQFYKYGNLPTFFLAAAALLTFLLSFFLPEWRSWRKSSLFTLLAVLIGTSLVTNVIFKELWSRPRPVQTVDFGGFAPFHPFYRSMTEPTIEPVRSLPSGHAAAGFSFLTLCFVGYRKKEKRLFVLGLFLTLLLGVGLSLTRIAQGGHYLSDVLVSALILWCTCWGLDLIFYREIHERAYR